MNLSIWNMYLIRSGKKLTWEEYILWYLNNKRIFNAKYMCNQKNTFIDWNTWEDKFSFDPAPSTPNLFRKFLPRRQWLLQIFPFSFSTFLIFWNYLVPIYCLVLSIISQYVFPFIFMYIYLFLFILFSA